MKGHSLALQRASQFCALNRPLSSPKPHPPLPTGGWITAYEVGLHGQTGAVADVRVNCSDGNTYSSPNVVGVADIKYQAYSGIAASGRQSVSGIAGVSAIAQFAAMPNTATGTIIPLACPSGSVIIGLELIAYLYSGSRAQQLM